jgi:hypothetical protein
MSNEILGVSMGSSLNEVVNENVFSITFTNNKFMVILNLTGLKEKYDLKQ